MSKVLTQVFGAENLPILEKLAAEAIEAAQQEPAEETQAEEPSALDLLAHNRAEQMLKIAAEVLESEGQTEGAPAEGDQTAEQALDEAVTLRALEKIAEAGYDPDAVIELLNRSQRK